jgi:signal transduction histidine kinase
MPRLFTKFTSKSFKGTGLGLFISKSIIEAHGIELLLINRSKWMLAISAFAIGFFPVSIMMSGVIVGLFYGMSTRKFLSFLSFNISSKICLGGKCRFCTTK